MEVPVGMELARSAEAPTVAWGNCFWMNTSKVGEVPEVVEVVAVTIAAEKPWGMFMSFPVTLVVTVALNNTVRRMICWGIYFLPAAAIFWNLAFPNLARPIFDATAAGFLMPGLLASFFCMAAKRPPAPGGADASGFAIRLLSSYG